MHANVHLWCLSCLPVDHVGSGWSPGHAFAHEAPFWVLVTWTSWCTPYCIVYDAYTMRGSVKACAKCDVLCTCDSVESGTELYVSTVFFVSI